MCLDSDSDEEPPVKKTKHKEKMPSALECKTQRVDTLANELKEKHGNKFDKIQYKLWAEALDVGKHESKGVPPLGPIWGDRKSKVPKRVLMVWMQWHQHLPIWPIQWPQPSLHLMQIKGLTLPPRLSPTYHVQR